MLAVSAGLAVGDWIAVATGRKWLEWICKPGTLLGLLLWFAFRAPVGSTPAASAFAIGLMLSLVGDLCLLRPGAFRQGLLAFLAAHLAYIAAFNVSRLMLSGTALLLAGIAAVLTGLLLRRLLPALAATQRAGLRGPIAIYACVLALMAWSAAVAPLRPEWLPLAGELLAAGGVLFLLSDSALAWNRFVHPLPGGRLFEHISYHLAQICLTIGMGMQYG